MTNKPSLDFTKVEALRRHMLLTIQNMSQLLGVSRTTYYSWMNGKAIRKSNDETVRIMLRRLLSIMTDHNWPTPEVIASDQKHRMARLIKLLN
jgi:DNA-binding XRE family transcriptional regulator